MFRYHKGLKESQNITTTLTLLKQIMCVRVTQDMLEQSQIEETLTEMLFHSDCSISKTAACILVKWKDVYNKQNMKASTGVIGK